MTSTFVKPSFCWPPPSLSCILLAVEKELISEVKDSDTLVIVGETGSGKTTRECPFVSFTHVCSQSSGRKLELAVAWRACFVDGLKLLN